MSRSVTESQACDAVVVGSGFGGAITACRLAQAGCSVRILERGRRWAPKDFPRDVEDTDTLFWRHAHDPAARGLFELRFFSGLGVVAAAGVGGGSLIYANIHIRPDPIVFDDPRWPAGYHRQALDPYYDRVRDMLGIAPVPPEVALAKRQHYAGAARSHGRPHFDPDQAVAWTDPGEPGRSACQHCAECEFGCRYGAKNTLDFNYLRTAEAHGARLDTGCIVRWIEPAGSAGYRVVFEEAATGRVASVVGKRVVLAAGTLGTLEILFRSRDEPAGLPELSPRLGYGFSGNGDFLGSLQNAKVDLEPWHGPDVTTVMRFFDDAPHFTLAAPTFNRATMAVLASLGQTDGRGLRWLPKSLFRRLESLIPWAFRKGFLSQPVARHLPGAGPPERMTNLFAIGRDNAGGRARWNGRRLDIEWRFAEENTELVAAMIAAMEKVARHYGGTFAPLPTWSIFQKPLTVHPLGGCNLSESAETGVVDPTGQVHGYPGLYVADGSVIPTAIGFHPVMTLSAVAERIAEGLANAG